MYIFIPKSAAAPTKETSHRKNNHVIVEGHQVAREEEGQLRKILQFNAIFGAAEVR